MAINGRFVGPINWLQRNDSHLDKNLLALSSFNLFSEDLLTVSKISYIINLPKQVKYKSIVLKNDKYKWHD
jgi:hypothetical protein